MNFVFLSPHFPDNFKYFCIALNKEKINVLGIGDTEYGSLDPLLTECLTEYYKVSSMGNYDEILRACGYFTHKYGKIRFFESLNEHWLPTESSIRKDFNIRGFKPRYLSEFIEKSEMKKLFQKHHIPVAMGQVVSYLDEAQEFVKKCNYPVIAKPNRGVGAQKTQKIRNTEELTDYFKKKSMGSIFLEEFVKGKIFSFDGLVDSDGNIVFQGGFEYCCQVMDCVNLGADVAYFTLREIPPELEKYGRTIVDAYQLRNRFFHIEFFQKDLDSSWVALEANLRPPGGWSVDMYNYAYNIDLYSIWAKCISGRFLQQDFSTDFHCAFVSRRNKKKYKNHDVLEKYKDYIVNHSSMPELFTIAMGDYGFLLKHPSKAKILEMIHYIHQ